MTGTVEETPTKQKMKSGCDMTVSPPTMSSRALSGTQSVNSIQQSTLSFPRSDGDPSKRPPNVEPTQDESGSVNYHKFVPLSECSSISWRSKTGAAVAALLGKSSIRTSILPVVVADHRIDPQDYVFDDFPEHYAFYDHNKGPAANPRHDLYLYGNGDILLSEQSDV
jgi:Transcription-silencing protein, cryptic loci regulator Clr2